MPDFLKELSRRNVFRVAVAYIIVGWIVLQVVGLLAPGLGLPEWTLTFIFVLLLAAFPVGLLLAWAFELTPEGFKRSGDVEVQSSVSHQTGRKLDFAIIGVLSVALLFFIADKLFRQSDGGPFGGSDLNRSSIAVLPFVNMSNDPDQIYFSDGISEEILNTLAQIPELHVTSRSSAFQFRGNDIHIPTVAGQLGVANILEGSVRKSGTRIRITAQLIDASTDRHLWTDTYDRELTDIFAIQDEISKAIVDALHVHLGLESPAPAQVHETDADAYWLYLLGRHNFEQRTQDTLYKSIQFFDQAIAIDPAYAPAWSGKADAYLLLYDHGYLGRKSAVVFAEPLIKRALQLDANLAEAHASRCLLFMTSYQYAEALKACDHAIKLNPNLSRAWQWKGISLRGSFDHQGEFKSLQQANALDPLSPNILSNLIWSELRFGRFSEAEKLLETLQAVGSEGTSLSTASYYVNMMQGRWSAAYTIVNPRFEETPLGWNGWAAGSTERALRAFEPGANRYSDWFGVIINFGNDPATAWRDYQAWPQAKKEKAELLVEEVAFGMARLGKYKDVVELLEPMPLPVAGDVIFPQESYAAVLAFAKQKTGDEAGAKHLISEIETYIMALKDQGATWTLSEFEAQVHALKGEDDAVVTALEQAHKDGYLTWHKLTYPLYDSVRDREDFQAIVHAVDAKVNEERAKLGWEPFSE